MSRVWGRVYDILDLAGPEPDLQTKLSSRQIQKIVDPTPRSDRVRGPGTHPATPIANRA